MQPTDQALMTLRDRLVDRVNTAGQNSKYRSNVLETQIKELETKIEDVKAEHHQLNKELTEAKSEAEKWKARYECLRKLMLDPMDRHF